MFATLFKNEARQTGRPLLIGAAIWVGVVAFTVALSLLPWGALTDVLRTIALLLTVLGPTAAGAFLLVQYYRTMAGRQAYLTFAIPVRGRVLWAAKAAWAAGVMAAASLVAALLCLVTIGITQAANGRPFRRAVGDLLNAFGTSGLWLAVAAIGLLIAFSIAEFGFFVSFGSRASMHRFGIGGPVLVGVLTYVGLQVLSFLAIIGIPVGLRISGDRAVLVRHNFLAELTVGGPNQPVPIGFVPLFVIAAVVFAWLTVRTIERHTSVR